MKKLNIIPSIKNGHCFTHSGRKRQNNSHLDIEHYYDILGAILKKRHLKENAGISYFINSQT